MTISVYLVLVGMRTSVNFLFLPLICKDLRLYKISNAITHTFKNLCNMIIMRRISIPRLRNQVQLPYLVRADGNVVGTGRC